MLAKSQLASLVNAVRRDQGSHRALDSASCTNTIICMRTTLVLDENWFRQAKRRAAERNVTVSDIVNEALRESFRRPAQAVPPFSMITYGRSGRRTHHEPSDFAVALENEDRDRLR